VNDLLIRHNLWNDYILYFNINNIFNEQYETTRDYSQMDRAFNFGVKKLY